MTARGDQTRQHLLDVAERLFAEKGCSAVSLREIRLAAGARNTAAMQFHFGDRDGLIDALAARHMPQIAALQQQIYDRIIAEGRRDDARSLVEVLIRPGAEYLTYGDNQLAWVKIMGGLSSEPELRAVEMRSYAPAPALEVAAALYTKMSATMPPAIAAERLTLLAQIAVQLSADRARIEEHPDGARRSISMQAFVENLIDMVCAALFAPVSPTTIESAAAGDREPKPDRTSASGR